jgi:hypothetical protein
MCLLQHVGRYLVVAPADCGLHVVLAVGFWSCMAPTIHEHLQLAAIARVALVCVCLVHGSVLHHDTTACSAAGFRPVFSAL